MTYYASLPGARVKTSSLIGEVPTYELEEGELAVNVTDGNIFVKHQGMVKNVTSMSMNKSDANELRIMHLEAKLVDLQMKIEKLTPAKLWLDQEADAFEKKSSNDKSHDEILGAVLEKAKRLNW